MSHRPISFFVKKYPLDFYLPSQEGTKNPAGLDSILPLALSTPCPIRNDRPAFHDLSIKLAHTRRVATLFPAWSYVSLRKITRSAFSCKGSFLAAYLGNSRSY
jgi:hypothetical protein